MRLMGPGHLLRIARFLNTWFTSNRTARTDSRKGDIWSLQRFALVSCTAFLLAAAIPSSSLAQARSVFHFSKEVHWGDAVLPPGDYVVTSLDVKNTGAVLTFATPKSLPRSSDSSGQVVSSDSAPGNGAFFTIRNTRNRNVPYAEIQTIYLSACRVVEQEFSRSEPLRPRLTLLLGSDTDRVFYPNREIQLKKWDDYKFAQGVVILAVNDMLPEDKKYSLSKLALLQAESTVDVRELKSRRRQTPSALMTR